MSGRVASGIAFSVDETAAIFAEFNPEFRPDNRGCWRGSTAYRGGDSANGLSIDLPEGVWFDFVTGQGGDVISFVEAACDTDFLGACRLIAEIIGRDPLGRERKPVAPYSEAELTRAECFRTGYGWLLDEYLDELKQSCWEDPQVAERAKILDATKLREWIATRSTRELAGFVRGFKKIAPRCVSQCIKDAATFQLGIAGAIGAADSRREAA